MVMVAPSLFFMLLVLCAICSAECGDGRLDLPVEECDDGNSVNSDGCSGCFIDRYYTCVPTPGRPTPCWSTYCLLKWRSNVPVLCGDGRRHPSIEQCDDGNNRSGDGCSNCTIDAGFTCKDSPKKNGYFVSKCTGLLFFFLTRRLSFLYSRLSYLQSRTIFNLCLCRLCSHALFGLHKMLWQTSWGKSRLLRLRRSFCSTKPFCRLVHARMITIELVNVT